MPENIGERIKALRVEQRMTLSDLGEKVNLSTSYLSQIERDKTAPSLSTLMDIARALDVGPRYFFETEAEVAYIQRAGRGPERVTTDSPIECRPLTLDGRDNKLGANWVTLRPHTPPALLDPYLGEEFVFVLSGELTISIGDEQVVLAAGDSIHYNAYQTCYRSNAGDTPCTAIWGRAASLQDH